MNKTVKAGIATIGMGAVLIGAIWAASYSTSSTEPRGLMAQSTAPVTKQTVYRVPAGPSGEQLQARRLAANENTSVPLCTDYDAPSIFPCVAEFHAVATDDKGAQGTAVERFELTQVVIPTPSPTPLPYCASGQRPINCICRNGYLGKSGKCR